MTEKLPQHLQQVHKLKRDDAKYRKCMSVAKVVSMKKPHLFLRMQAERESNIGGEYDQYSSPSFDSLSSQKDLEDDHLTTDPDHTVSDTGDASRSGNDDTEEPLADVHVAETMKQFADWLVSPDCEKKDEKTAKQHVAQVKKVLSIIGGGTCLQSLLDAKQI